MPSLSPKRHKHIIIVCMALHNFIYDSELRDEEFEKCDDENDYMFNICSTTRGKKWQNHMRMTFQSRRMRFPLTQFVIT
jgi:hypothetical protein